MSQPWISQEHSCSRQILMKKSCMSCFSRKGSTSRRAHLNSSLSLLICPEQHLLEQRDVYAEDCILGVVKNYDRSLISRVSQATLQAIHSIFPPPECTGHLGGKYPISQRKLQKKILRFMINGSERTAWLFRANAQSTASRDITKLLCKSHTSLDSFRSILGLLQLTPLEFCQQPAACFCG